MNRFLNIFKQKDEICGNWSSEDGSGFSMMMGSWVSFKSDGTGEYESWSNGDDDTSYNNAGKFTWKRTNKQQIEITELNSAPELIDYKIKTINGAKELSNLSHEMTGNHRLEGFWNFYQNLYKL